MITLFKFTDCTDVAIDDFSIETSTPLRVIEAEGSSRFQLGKVDYRLTTPMEKIISEFQRLPRQQRKAVWRLIEAGDPRAFEQRLPLVWLWATSVLGVGASAVQIFDFLRKTLGGS